jgi:hypothetical protein
MGRRIVRSSSTASVPKTRRAEASPAPVESKSEMPPGTDLVPPPAAAPAPAAAAAAADLTPYWDRLKNLIPAEVSALYVAGQSVIPAEQRVAPAIWALLCLIFVLMATIKQTQTADGQSHDKYPTDWTHVIISAVSFLIWVYALGGPFVILRMHLPWIGALLMLSWTFLVPQLYHGTAAPPSAVKV